MAAMGYDAAYLLVDAIKRANIDIQRRFVKPWRPQRTLRVSVAI